jgi:hypothetical protein
MDDLSLASATAETLLDVLVRDFRASHEQDPTPEETSNLESTAKRLIAGANQRLTVGTIFISEFTRVANAQMDVVATALQMPAHAEHAVTVRSDRAAVSPRFDTATSVVRLVSTTPVFIAIGPSPEARVGAHFIPPGVPCPYGVTGGHRLSVIGLRNRDGFSLDWRGWWQ